MGDWGGFATFKLPIDVRNPCTVLVVGESEIWKDERRAFVSLCSDKAWQELILGLSNKLTDSMESDGYRQDVSLWEERSDVTIGIDIVGLEDFGGRIGVASFDEHFCGVRSCF